MNGNVETYQESKCKRRTLQGCKMTWPGNTLPLEKKTALSSNEKNDRLLLYERMEWNSEVTMCSVTVTLFNFSC